MTALFISQKTNKRIENWVVALQKASIKQAICGWNWQPKAYRHADSRCADAMPTPLDLQETWLWAVVRNDVLYSQKQSESKQVRGKTQTFAQELHWIIPLNQSVKLHSSIDICQGVPIKRLRVLTSVYSYSLISSHQGHSHILSPQLLSTPSRIYGNRHW